MSNRISNLKKIIQEEREKQKKLKIQTMRKEKIEAQKRFKQQEELAIKAKYLGFKVDQVGIHSYPSSFRAGSSIVLKNILLTLRDVFILYLSKDGIEVRLALIKLSVVGHCSN